MAMTTAATSPRWSIHATANNVSVSTTTRWTGSPAPFTGNNDCATVDAATGVDPYDITYDHDAMGSITQVDQNLPNLAPTPYTYAGAQPHAVTAVGPDTFAYDDNDSLTDRTVDGDTQTLTYDIHRRLEGVDGPGGDDFAFLYDADGARVAQTGPAETTYYIGGDYEYTDTGQTTVHYQHGDRRVAFRVDGDLKIVFTDLIGSTAAVLDDATSMIDRVRYMPFGAPRGTQPATGTTRLFTGQHADDTGLMFYNARYYVPVARRFAQPDTVVADPANRQDLNRYTYVRNNPTGHADPSGHAPLAGTGGPGTPPGPTHTSKDGEAIVCSSGCGGLTKSWTPTGTGGGGGSDGGGGGGSSGGHHHHGGGSSVGSTESKPPSGTSATETKGEAAPSGL